MSFTFRGFADAVLEIAHGNDDAVAIASHLFASIVDDDDLAHVVRWMSSRRTADTRRTVAPTIPTRIYAILTGTNVDEPGSLDHEMFLASRTMAGSSIETIRMLLIARERAGMPPIVRSEGLLVVQVAHAIDNLSSVSATAEKVSLLLDLWRAMNPDEIWVLHTIVSRLTGSFTLNDDALADAISRAFAQPLHLVRHALVTQGDAGVTAVAARHGELDATFVTAMRVVPAMRAQTLASVTDSDGTPGLLPKLDSNREYIVEQLLPGARVQLHAWQSNASDDVMIAILSPSGRDLSRALPRLIERLSQVPAGSVIDGHVIVDDSDDCVIGITELERSATRGVTVDDGNAMFVGFDLLVEHGVSLLDHPLDDRRFRLERIAEHALLPVTRTTSIRDHESFEQMFTDDIASDGQGLIAKSRDSAYEFGRRSGSWQKTIAGATLLAVVRYAAAGPDGRDGPLVALTFGVWTIDADEPRLVNIGRTECDYADDGLKGLASRLKALRVKRFGYNYEIEPSIVCELEYDAIRVSPRTDAGYTIRIARIRCVRWDLAVGAVASIADVERHHRMRSRARLLGDAIYIP